VKLLICQSKVEGYLWSLLLDHSRGIAGVSIGSTAPGSLTQSDQGIDLDEAMQPTENDRYRPEYKIDGISDEVGDELDELGKHHPCCERIAGNPSLISGPVRGGHPQAQPEQDIADDCRWHEGSRLHRIGAVELLSPNVPLNKHAGPITAPVAACPS